MYAAVEALFLILLMLSKQNSRLVTSSILAVEHEKSLIERSYYFHSQSATIQLTLKSSFDHLNDIVSICFEFLTHGLL